jgi:hypothetical protein
MCFIISKKYYVFFWFGIWQRWEFEVPKLKYKYEHITDRPSTSKTKSLLWENFEFFLSFKRELFWSDYLSFLLNINISLIINNFYVLV